MGQNKFGGLTGPGPNYFSDSTNNVWVDAQGLLHLKITHLNNAWQWRGNHHRPQLRLWAVSFHGGRPGQRSWTQALSWDSSRGATTPPTTTGKLTLNCRAGATPSAPTTWENYAIAPYGGGQVLRFPLPADVTNSTHSFIWQSNRIAFQSLNGDFNSPPPATNILKSWNYQLATPPAGGEQVRINLWLDDGNAPTNGQTAEVIISKFEFVPLGSPQPALLKQLNGFANGNVQLNIQGMRDWRYQIYSSSNLLDWLQIGSLLATNDLFQFTDPNPVSFESRFYRTLTRP